jgi:hypothetical protein
MIQSNEETGNKRPVMIFLKEKPEEKEGQETNNMDTEHKEELKEDKKGNSLFPIA